MTSETTGDLTLAAEFPPATRADWMKLVEAALKGAPFDRKLVSKTYDGLRIEPLYERVPDAQPVAGRPPAAPWQIMQRIDHPDPAAANAQALHDLENGATGLTLVIAGSTRRHGYGLAATEAAIERALDGVYLDAGIAFEIDGGAETDAARFVAELVKRRDIAPATTDIRFGLDPLSPEDSPKQIAALAGQGFGGPFAAADGRIVTMPRRLGGAGARLVLAVAVAYLRALEAGGIALDAARTHDLFPARRRRRSVPDARQVSRAAQTLGARRGRVRARRREPIFVSAETAWRMMTRRDPYVNMLRATIAVFSAGLGGADAITVLPFTLALGLPDRFARRIARNTQLILLEESNLAKVSDPAAGSGGIEDLTDKLCGAAWALVPGDRSGRRRWRCARSRD